MGGWGGQDPQPPTPPPLLVKLCQTPSLPKGLHIPLHKETQRGGGGGGGWNCPAAMESISGRYTPDEDLTAICIWGLPGFRARLWNGVRSWCAGSPWLCRYKALTEADPDSGESPLNKYFEGLPDRLPLPHARP